METKKFAIEQAIRLVSTMPIDNKTKAVFDFAEDIIKWIGEPTKVERKPYELYEPFTPITPIYTTPPSYTPMPQVYPPWEVTCATGSTEG